SSPVPGGPSRLTTSDPEPVPAGAPSPAGLGPAPRSTPDSTASAIRSRDEPASPPAAGAPTSVLSSRITSSAIRSMPDSDGFPSPPGPDTSEPNRDESTSPGANRSTPDDGSAPGGGLAP